MLSLYCYTGATKWCEGWVAHREGQGCVGRGGGTHHHHPLQGTQPTPSYVSLTASASFNGIGNRQ